MAYFHPRTGSETTPSIDYARVLETTSREVRRIVSSETEAPVMPTGVETLSDLLFKVLLNTEIPVNQILSLRASNTVRELPPQTFEGMWKVVFGLGLVPGYENVKLYKGKVEKTLAVVKKAKMLDHLAASKLATDNTSGASDITLGFHEEEEQAECTAPLPDTEATKKKMFLFCSSKFYTSDKKKNVDSYDVANIISAANYAGYTDDRFRIILLVKNKEVVKGKFASAYRRYLTYIVEPEGDRDGVLGREDLEAAITRLRERVGDRKDPRDFIQTVLLGGKTTPQFLSLRFHQELIVRKTLEIYAAKTYDSVLWGVVARGGKTYICGGLIRDMRPHAKYVFIVAGAYTETHTQFLDDLLDVRKNGYQDFDEYTAVNVRDEEFTFDPSKKYIFFISAELLKAFVEGKTGKKARERTVMTLVQNKTIVPELVFFDEVHKGGTTSLADDAMSLIAGSAFKVFMTATYNKLFIKDEYGITQDNFLTWGYEDIQLAKGMDAATTVDLFGKKYGKELVDSVLTAQAARGVSAVDIAKQYQKFPELQFLTTTFSDTFRTSMQKQNILDPSAGFRMNTLLATGPGCMDVGIKKRYRCLTNPASVGVLLNYIAPHTSQMSSVGKQEVLEIEEPGENVMTRIGRTSQRRDDILKNVHTEFRPHSQLWFLPQPTSGADDTPLMSRMTAFGSLIMKHPWFSKHFSVVAVSSGFGRTDITYYEKSDAKQGAFIATTNGESNTKKTIIDLEKKAYAAGRGLIILAGKMLTLGVSLPCVNVVALLDDSQSSDLTYQKMFRALTESEGKKIGYIIDVNPVRTLKTVYDYTKVEHDASDVLDDKVDATVLTNLYLIDEDQLFVLDKEKRVGPAELNKAIETYLMAGRKTYRSIVDEASVKIAGVDLTKELELLRADLNAVKPEAVQVASRLAGDAVPSGLEIVKAEKPKKNSEKVQEDDTKEKLQALREMILTTMTLLAFLTTFTTFAEALDYYSKDTDNIQDIIHSVLVDRGLTTETTKTKVKETLIVAINKVQAQLAQPYGRMRAKLADLSGDQKEVVEFIQQNLRPKKEQVASRGEVFTPLTLVEEMLNRLPEDVWSHPEYKWLDPSNGIGNFPVIAFTKLDAGLRTVRGFEDDMVRRRHIVENMLYMVELDDANVRLSQRLLEKMCGDTKCKFNLLKQDFLIGDIAAAFGVKGFNVAMGNPPYNPPKTETGSSGNAIWQNFVMKMEGMLEDGGYLVVVHPPGWKKPTEDAYNPAKFASGNFKGQIRQGQVWQYLKTRGSFHYIYTNDQRSKTLEYFQNFPAVDYYVYQRGKPGGKTSTRNIFCGKVYESSDITIPPELPYLPCIITQETIAILSSVISGSETLTFTRGIDERTVTNWGDTEIEWFYDANKRGFQFKRHGSTPTRKTGADSRDTVNVDKLVVNFGGGFDAYNVKFVAKDDKIGVLDKTMYAVVDQSSGPKLEEFFKSDIVKTVFLITQYASGAIHQNELAVANSIRVPPPSTTNYYTFFNLERYKTYIETLLANYAEFKAPKQAKQATTLETPRRKRSPNTTQRNKPKE